MRLLLSRREVLRVLLGVGVLLAIFASAACSSTSNDEPQAQSEPGEEGPIVLGNVGSKTGFMEFFDGPQLQGAKLAIEELNEAGGVLGRPLEMVEVDSKTDTEVNFNAALEAIEGGAVALIASSDFDFGGPGAVAAQDEGVPSISPGAADPKFGAQGIGPLAFTMSSTTNNTGAVMAEFAYNTKGFLSTWILVDESIEYSKSIADYFTERWTELAGDGTLSTETFAQEDASIAPQIAKFEQLAEEPDVIVVSSYLPGGATAVRQIRAAGIDVPIILNEAFEGDLFFDTAGRKTSNVFGLMNGWIYGGVDPVVDELVNSYEELVGEQPDTSQFLLGYAAVRTFAQAIEDCQCTDGEKIAEAMEKFTDVNVGPFTITLSDTEHNPVLRSMVIWEAMDGERVYVDTVTPEQAPAPRF